MEGYKILFANNGKEGVEIAREFIPDLIICDVQMPKMDGYEVLRLLLDTAKTYEIPFIFSTSNSEKVDRTKAHELETLLALSKKWIKSGSDRHN